MGNSNPPIIPDRVYFRIGDVAELVGVKPYVIRYWESEFSAISPEKSQSGQRVYRRSDIETILLIKHLLYSEGYSIEGARKRLRELRKSGELESLRNKVLGGATSTLDASLEALQENSAARHAESAKAEQSKIELVKELAEEIQTLSEIPIEDLFRR